MDSPSAHKYLLFGPPASRKSTLIRMIPRLTPWAQVLDLEQVLPGSRLTLIEALGRAKFETSLFVGAADLAPGQIPEAFRIVFLFPEDRAAYLEFLESRNRADPRYLDQREAETYDAMARIPREVFFMQIDPIEGNLDDEAFSRAFLTAIGFDLGRR